MDEKYKDAVNMKQTMKMTNAFRKIIFLCFKCKCLLLEKMQQSSQRLSLD